MLELNLTGLQKGGNLKGPSDEEAKITEAPKENHNETNEEAVSAGPKLGLSLSSLKSKKEEPAEEAPIADEITSAPIVEASAEDAISAEEPKEEILMIEEVQTEDITPLVLEEVPEEIEEEATSVLSLSSLKSDSEQAKKVQAKKEEVIVEVVEIEEKKEFFPSFNALASFEDEDVLRLNKNYDNLADGESQSILSTAGNSMIAKEEENVNDPAGVTETAIQPAEAIEIVASDTTETIKEEAAMVENLQEPSEIQTIDTEAIKEDLSKKRAFAGLTPFKKKILIYSVAAFSVCGIGLAALTGGDRQPDIKANINEILLPPIKYKEGVDFNINKNNKKNIRKIKVEATGAMSGETSTGTIMIPDAAADRGDTTMSGTAVTEPIQDGIAIPPADPARVDPIEIAPGSGPDQQVSEMSGGAVPAMPQPPEMPQAPMAP